MSRRFGAALAAMAVLSMLAAGCMAGPTYRPDQVIAPEQRIGAPLLSDSARRFFDSLAVARARDSVRTVPGMRVTLTDASISAVAWMDILRDSTLVRLVDTAIRQNRDLRVAVARIDEFRADVGLARSPLLPSLSVNASEGSNQVALGAFPPTSFRATRVTGDLAWAAASKQRTPTSARRRRRSARRCCRSSATSHRATSNCSSSTRSRRLPSER
jgi:outer membrane protein TolC